MILALNSHTIRMIINEIDIQDDGVLYFWYDPFYQEKIKKRSLKKGVEREEVSNQLKRKLGDTIEIVHTVTGKPKLYHAEFDEISISHAQGWYAILLTSKSEGIDIQTFKENIAEGKYYFVNPTEDETIEKTTINYHLIWSAKEAIYKKYEGQFDNLKNNVTILTINDSIIEVRIDKINKIERCSYQITNDWVLVWTH